MNVIATEEIMALHKIHQKWPVLVAVVGLGAMLAGCSREIAGTSLASSMTGAPVAVACEPNQRAVVRQAPVNGVLQAQVQCESVGATGTFGATSPVAYQPGFQPVALNGYGPAPTDNARIVRTAYPERVVTRDATARRATSYQPTTSDRVYRPKRSVTKSAVIIGSSAGVGAGLGAVIGGKKGAGIGALIGGGGAALWDQMTRRR